MSALLEEGGLCMYALMGVCVLLWYSVFQRFQRASAQARVWTKACVVVAPLLGLLGTVSGMIATFDGLMVMQIHSSAGGIAGGISQALLTTQAGLLVAAPGLSVDRFLVSRGL